MPLSQAQFTIGQLVYLTLMCAIVFSALRIGGPAYILIFVPIIVGLAFDRAKQGQGLGSSILFRCLAFVGCVIAYCTYFYFYPDPMAVENGVLILCFCSPFLLASLWRFTFSKRCDSKSLTDEPCGPIDWQGFDGDREPASREPSMRENDA
jgi:hypothetical protein